jgi:hypothetical protein
VACQRLGVVVRNIAGDGLPAELLQRLGGGDPVGRPHSDPIDWFRRRPEAARRRACFPQVAREWAPSPPPAADLPVDYRLADRFLRVMIGVFWFKQSSLFSPVSLPSLANSLSKLMSVVNTSCLIS